MSTPVSLAPGARVRTTHGFIGRLERLEQRGPSYNDQPDHLLVRSEDGQQFYLVPLMLVKRVVQGAQGTIVDLAIGSDELQHYMVEPLQSEQHTGTRTVPTENDEPALRIPLASEELVTRKEPVILGNIHVHKGVKTIEQSLNVPVYHEEVSIEHIPPERYDAHAPVGPDEVIIPILEERLIIQKQSVVKEYIRIRKQLIAQQETIHEGLRREFVDITNEGPDEPHAAEQQAPD
jgi:uncharacterized protein (TIGR02271 family)